MTMPTCLRPLLRVLFLILAGTKPLTKPDYMLIPESGSRGNGTSLLHAGNFSRQLQGLIRAVRNHPCVEIAGGGRENK